MVVEVGLAQLGQLAPQVRRAPLARPELQVRPARAAPLGQLGLVARPAPLVPLAHQVRLVQLVQLAQLELLVPLGLAELLVHQGLLAYQGLPAPLARRALRAHPEPLAHPARPVRLGPVVDRTLARTLTLLCHRPQPQEQARATSCRMSQIVSSSPMERIGSRTAMAR